MSEITLYRNDNIKLDFHMSKLLKEIIAEADMYYEKKDWFWYDLTRRDLEASSKQEVLSGIISDEQRKKIWERYGI